MPSELRPILPAIRTFLEPKWRQYRAMRRRAQWDDGPVAQGVCRHTALFLLRLLRVTGALGWNPVHGYCRIAGSGPYAWVVMPRTTPPLPVRSGTLVNLDQWVEYCGVQDADGEWRAPYVLDGVTLWAEHWWLERPPARLDLTVGHSGWPAVFVGTARDARYRTVGATDRGMLHGVGGTVRAWEADPHQHLCVLLMGMGGAGRVPAG
jgi:hypothetical protein